MESTLAIDPGKELSRASTAWPPRVIFWRFCAVVGAYFAMQAIFRTVSSAALQWDEAEQVIWAQGFKWGYGAQPPLYNWLQQAFIKVFGLNVLALALCKNAALASIFIFTFLLARRLHDDARLAVMATGMLMFVWPLSWDAQRDKTHSILVAALVPATVWAYLGVMRSPRWRSYALLGVMAGLGIMAKYNFAIFLVALVVTALLDRRGRAALLNPGATITLGIIVAITLPHLLWLAGNASDAARAATRLDWRGHSLAYGLGQFVRALAAGAGPAIAGGLFIFPSALRTPSAEKAFAIHRLLLFMLAGLFLLLIVGVRDFGHHWFLPLLVLLPVWFVGRLQGVPRWRVWSFWGWVSVMAVVMAVVIGGQVQFACSLGRPTQLNTPIQTLAACVKDNGFRKGTIFCFDHRIAAGLSIQLPGSVVDARFNHLLQPAIYTGGDIVVVWNLQWLDALSEGMKAAAAEATGRREPTSESKVTLPLFCCEDHQEQFGIAVWRGRE